MKLIIALSLAYSFLILMILSLFKAGSVAGEEMDRAIKKEIERRGA